VAWVIWNLILVRLEIVLVSAQYRCTVCTECTIGSEVLGDVGHMESRFDTFGDRASAGAR
jgi:hypothetical protein